MQAGRRATIADVAKLAGVSRTSVSRVLNGRAELTDATRQRVNAAIQALGYRPSEVARSLTSQRTHTIGMMVYDILNPGMAESVFSAQTALARHGYRVILACMGRQAEVGRDALSLFDDRRVDGIITGAVIETATPASKRLPDFTGNGTYCYEPLTGRVSRVKFDEASGGEQAAEHLLAQGHRRFGIVTGPRWWGSVEERLHGYRGVMAKRGISPDQTVVEVTDEWTTPAGYAALNQLLNRAPDLTAIWALYDVLAVGVMRALVDRGKRIPDDVALIGYNDEIVASYTVPRLTSIHADCNTTGRIAAELMLELLDDAAAPPREVIVPTELTVRDSSRPIGPMPIGR